MTTKPQGPVTEMQVGRGWWGSGLWAVFAHVTEASWLCGPMYNGLCYTIGKFLPYTACAHLPGG